MQQQKHLLGVLKGAAVLLCALMVFGACTPARSAPQHQAVLGVPVESRALFIGRFEGEFSRDMRVAVAKELAKSERFRVVDTEASADFVLSGGVHIRSQRPDEPPEAWVVLQSRTSGTRVWQYTYLDQRTGNELFFPPAQRQVQIVAHQFVAQLLTVSTERAANVSGSF